MLKQKLSGEKIYLKRSDCRTWINARADRYSKEAFEYDPGMPHKSIEEEITFYEEFVRKNLYLIYGIYKTESNELIGFIVAFEFIKTNSDIIEPFGYYPEGGTCETGIGIFRAENFGKGYGSGTYKIFLKMLKDKYNINSTTILTNPDNIRAKRMYLRLGFKDCGIIKEQQDQFLKMKYDIISENQNE